jgi:hypothetical protein
MMTRRTGDRDLEAWLAAIEADDGQPDPHSLTVGIRNDRPTDQAGPIVGPLLGLWHQQGVVLAPC